MEGSKTLSRADIKLLPLPKELSSLPSSMLEEFAKSDALVEGYIRDLPEFKQYCLTWIQQIKEEISKLEVIKKDTNEYIDMSCQIKQKLKDIESSYHRFLHLQTTQYQLLTSNFNQVSLKLKLENLAKIDAERSRQLLHKLDSSADSDFDASLDTFTREFKEARKSYHLRKEKLNRLNEERVTGFI